MTLTSLTASSLLQTLADSGGSSASLDGSLLSALGQTSQAAGAATSDPLLQTLVTLSSQNPSSTAAVQTYNAKGLLDQVEAAMPADPLLAADGSGQDGSGNALPADILGAGGGTGDASSSPASGSAGSLLQLFQNSPTLASAYVQSQVTRSLFDDMS
ncbi:MAG TPA: hypothetical protein VF816_00800 [Rhodocyclaceae bacterium]